MEKSQRSYMNYNIGIAEIEWEADQIAEVLTQGELSGSSLQAFLDQQAYKIMVLDQEGNVGLKSANVYESKVDYQKLLEYVVISWKWARMGEYDQRKEYSTIRPVTIDHQSRLLVVSGIPEGYVETYFETYRGPIPYMNGLIVFFLLFYLLTKRKMKMIEELANGLIEIAKGNLRYRVKEKSRDELGSLAANINHMAEELESQIERERKAEKTKNELITNVSHDLRTPLTMIMGYLKVLQDKRYESESEYEEYLNIAYEKSEKLKSLLDDLFEYTLLSSDGIKLKKERICINEMLEQLLEEYVPICEENRLVLRKELPQERVMLEIDANQMVRVFENLLNNAIKYSFRPGLIRVNMFCEEEYVLIQFRNNSDPIAKEDLARMFDRFYRIDTSRSSRTGGSGLGLAIAKSIVKLHDGEIWADSDIDTVTITVALKR